MESLDQEMFCLVNPLAARVCAHELLSILVLSDPLKGFLGEGLCENPPSVKAA